MSKYGTLKDYEGNKIYPNAYYKVGDIFITTNSENPADRFGGTWQKLPEETFLMTASSKYAIKSTGGENKVTLTLNEVPPHYHYLNNNGNDDTRLTMNAAHTGGNNYNVYMDSSSSTENGPYITTNYSGGGQSHNNMPKFYAVYIWIRVA